MANKAMRADWTDHRFIRYAYKWHKGPSGYGTFWRLSSDSGNEFLYTRESASDIRTKVKPGDCTGLCTNQAT